MFLLLNSIGSQFQQRRREQIHRRQADTDRQAGRQTGKQTGRQTGRQINRWTGTQINRWTGRQTGRSTDGQTRMKAFKDRRMGSRADLEGKEADVCRRLHPAEPHVQSPEGTTSCGCACACQGSAQLPLQPRAVPRCPHLPAQLALLPSPEFVDHRTCLDFRNQPIHAMTRLMTDLSL